jgi:hypothetical protein
MPYTEESQKGVYKCVRKYNQTVTLVVFFNLRAVLVEKLYATQ